MDIPQDQNASSEELEKIIAKAAQKLGPLGAPDYRRVKLNSQRYVQLITNLSHNFWVRDISDENEDVSSVLMLRAYRSNNLDDVTLYVSNVADYAFVMKEERDSSAGYLESLRDVLGGLGLQILSREILSSPVSALAFYSDQPKLFNILFSDTDYLPWELADSDLEDAATNDR